jgi:hypothetical protein
MAVEEVWRRADGFRGLGIIFVRFSCLFSSERTKLHWLIFFLSWARQDPWQPAACMWARTVLTAESNIVEDLDLLWAQAGWSHFINGPCRPTRHKPSPAWAFLALARHNTIIGIGCVMLTR